MKLPFVVFISLVTSLALRAEQAAAPAPASTVSVPKAPSTREKMGSRIWRWEDLKFAATKAGEQAPVVNQPTPTFQVFESHVTTLAPGNVSHAQHKHDREELILLKEGTLDVNLNDQPPIRVGAGSMFLFAANDMHNVKNVGTTPATYFVFNFTTGDTASRTDKPGATAAAVPGKLVSTVWDWDKLKAEPTKVGFRREIVNASTLTMRSFEAHVTTLNPGEAPHAPHRHPDEELVVVREGQMEVTINGVAQRAGPGSIFFYASNDEHGMKNIGTTPATYHVIRIVTDATPPAPAAK